MLENKLFSQKRIIIFVGEFGSGKTELAINYSLLLQSKGKKTGIADMDLVKPYFRARETRKTLEDKKVFVMAPEGGLAFADLPILPPHLRQSLTDPQMHVILDAAGGEAAIALAQVAPVINTQDFDNLFVINIRRPFTNSVKGICSMVEKIETVSRIKVTGLISNTNLAEETTLAEIKDGLAVTQEAAQQIQLPLKAVIVPEHLASFQHDSLPVFILKRYTHYPWMM